MALTGVQKTLIAQGAEALITPLGPFTVPFIILKEVIRQAFFPRQRAPRSPAGELLRQVDVIRQTRGIQGRISRDPFTGRQVVSTFNQDPILLELLFERAVREQGRIGVEERSAFDFETRQGVIEGLARTAQERGFPTTFDPALRGGVFRPAADQPLRFIEGNFLQ